jgi:response regulator RpfG family c-di-GMP phosphodiesterase
MTDTEDQPGRLLLVDDEENILKSLRRVFVPLGYEVHIALGGAKGLEILEAEEIDVIVSDMRMPEMDGAAFLKQAAEKWPNIRRLLLTGYAELESAISAINEGKVDLYLNKPWNDDDLTMKVKQVLESKRLKEKNLKLEAKVLDQNLELKKLNASLEEKVRIRTLELHEALESVKEMNDSTIQVLSSVVEMHETEGKGHCRQIADYAKKIAETMKLPENVINDVYVGGLLYNLGKIGLADALRTKPINKQTPEELAAFQQYPLYGEAALMQFKPLKGIADVLASHRERIDGKGFPKQLTGDDIPIGARIVSVVVDYLEMQAGLLVDESLTAGQALHFIQNNVGKRYEVKAVEAFTEIVESIPEEREALQEVILTGVDLDPGMVLTRDLRTEKGLVLLHKGMELSQPYIDKINQIGGLSVYVLPR